jgi:phosphoribosyl-AMP cyclohydrolase
MKTAKVEELDWKKMDNLMPVVAQEARTKEVLTLAYINPEALRMTLETGYAHYYRRSHGKIMMKGETSGNVQKIVDVLTDCDSDAVVYLVEQTCPACHLGERSCFFIRVEK